MQKRNVWKIATIMIALICLFISQTIAEHGVWDCPECGRTGNTGNFCGGCGHPAVPIGGETVIGENYKAGDTVTFGRYEQDHNYDNGKEDMEWIVLEVENGCMLLLSKYAIEGKEYHRNDEDTVVTWEISYLRKWLNNDFIRAAFNENEQAMIVESALHTGNNPEYRTKGGNDTTDRVFLLSYEEVNRYFSDDTQLVCYGTPHTNKLSKDEYTPNGSRLWWLRTPGRSGQLASIIYYDGSFDADGDYVFKDLCTVRPAVRIRVSD